MTYSLTLVLLLSGVAVCTATGVYGGYSQKTDLENPKYHELAHYAASTWSAQQAGKTHFDTVVAIEKVETQAVAGTNYKMVLKVVESVCPVSSTYTREACTPKPDAARRTCTVVVTEVSWENKRQVSSFVCAAA